MAELSIIQGDCRAVLPTLPAQLAQTVVTSPPYWGLRDYGHPDQIGLEPTPSEYVAHLVDVFREVRRVLRDDGTLWLNLGDTYINRANGGVGFNSTINGARACHDEYRRARDLRGGGRPEGLRHKQLVGIPWRVALALQDDGWILRADIVWAKPNPLPESVGDRPTRSHEFIFLFSKQESYFYDAAAIAEPSVSGRPSGNKRRKTGDKYGGTGANVDRGVTFPWEPGEPRNKRDVWTVTVKPFKDAHFATYPPELIEPCILAGSRPGDTVLDPFNGAGTTGLVAARHGRGYVGLEVNPEYVALSRRRIEGDRPLFNRVGVAT